MKEVFIALLSFIGSLVSMMNVSNFTTCISLNPSEYNQGLRYYPFLVNLDRYNRSCNTFDDPFGKMCVPTKIENVNKNIFNMIAIINESNTLTKHISCNCKCKFDVTKCNSNQKWNK